ncbi:MAG: macro domain-containing protein, partial [Clostridium sp.]|nr:macro domain-containing protein [Clostridium sp.]
MSFEIINKNIAEVQVEAVVNSANSKLLMSEGVCGSIFSLAGEKELQEECNKIGFCDTGDAVITKGYNLEAKYIIHAVGPVWNEGKDNEAEYLKKAYESSLKLVKDYNIKSVAFPLISAGAKGYPKRDVLDIATSVIKEFLEDNDDIDIYLAVLNREDIIIERELRRNIRIFKNAVRNSVVIFGK